MARPKDTPERKQQREYQKRLQLLAQVGVKDFGKACKELNITVEDGRKYLAELTREGFLSDTKTGQIMAIIHNQGERLLMLSFSRVVAALDQERAKTVTTEKTLKDGTVIQIKECPKDVTSTVNYEMENYRRQSRAVVDNMVRCGLVPPHIDISGDDHELVIHMYGLKSDKPEKGRKKTVQPDDQPVDKAEYQ